MGGGCARVGLWCLVGRGFGMTRFGIVKFHPAHTYAAPGMTKDAVVEGDIQPASYANERGDCVACFIFGRNVSFPQLLWLRKFTVASHAPKGHIRAATKNFLKLLVRE